MDITLTLDYELFFGRPTGTVSKTIVGATQKLLSVLDNYDIKAVFFVDIGFVKRLAYFKEDYPSLKEDYRLITQQLEKLSKNGHDLQLHVHPHWEDSRYENGKWKIDDHRYRLSDWSDEEVVKIVTEYKEFLEQFCINNTVFAYRAGGFCIQPFDKIGRALKKNKVWLDSTIFDGGYKKNESHFYDFRNIPSRSSWSFEEKPLTPNKNGFFRELPISSYKVSPVFYWRLALSRILNRPKHESFGDGHSLPASKKWLIKKLLLPSHIVASIDGFKASLLKDAFRIHHKKNTDQFIILGHPKALSDYSLSELEDFIKKYKSDHSFETFSTLREKKKIKSPYPNND